MIINFELKSTKKQSTYIYTYIKLMIRQTVILSNKIKMTLTKIVVAPLLYH